MSRLLVFAYGVMAYAVFFVTYLYAVGFVGNVGVPKSLDGTPTAPLGIALLIDLGLLGLFAVQHSVMARPAFKRQLVRVVPAAAERSTYVLASSLALLLLFWQWSPLGGVVWDVQGSTARAVLHGLFGFGFLLFAVMTTDYIVLAIQLEERDLIDAHPQYAEYKSRVPMMLSIGDTRTPRPVRTASTVGVPAGVLHAARVGVEGQPDGCVRQLARERVVRCACDTRRPACM